MSVFAHSRSSAKRPQANVMLSYPLAEAQTLLDNKLDAAKQSMANCEEDLDFLREQITVRGHYGLRLRCYHEFGQLADMSPFRPWKWPQHESTTGMWASEGRTRRTAKMSREMGKARYNQMAKSCSPSVNSAQQQSPYLEITSTPQTADRG